MGFCSRRNFLLSICTLQVLTIIERQVFDFLGYMWTPILINFFHIIFVIIGIFGTYQLRIKYIISYSVWSLIWIAWNLFLICFYLNAGTLDRNSDNILSFWTGSVSWFEVNGYGCKPIYPMNITSDDPFRPVRPETVENCLLEYEIIEVIHSSLQCLLSILGLIGAICIGRIFIEDDDHFDFIGGDAKSPQHASVHPMYVSYTSIPTDTFSTLNSKLNLSKLHILSHHKNLSSTNSSLNRTMDNNFGNSSANLVVNSSIEKLTNDNNDCSNTGTYPMKSFQSAQINCNMNSHSNFGYASHSQPRLNSGRRKIDRQFINSNKITQNDDEITNNIDDSRM